ILARRGGESRVTAARRPGAATAAAEKAHVARDDLGDVALVAVLVVVAAIGDAAFDVHLAAFREVLTAGLGLFAPDDDVVPLGLLLALTLLIGPALSRRDRELGDRAPARRETHVRVASQIADDDGLVHHGAPSLSIGMSLARGGRATSR